MKSNNLIAQNAAAVGCLTIAFTTSELIEFCTDSATDKYPAGIASEIVKKLFTKYRPVDVVAGVEAELELSRLKFKNSRHPDEFFTNLALWNFAIVCASTHLQVSVM